MERNLCLIEVDKAKEMWDEQKQNNINNNNSNRETTQVSISMISIFIYNTNTYHPVVWSVVYETFLKN